MRTAINKIINIGYKFLLIFSIICLSISLIGAIFFCVNRSYNYLNPLILIPGSLIYLFIIIRLYKFILNLDNKKKKYVVAGLLILQFILLLLSSLVMSSVPQVDLIHILTEINSLNNNGNILNNTYFSVYPNNRFLLILLYNIQKISINNSQLLFSIVSSLSISIMSFFTYKTVNKMFDINKGLLCLFICVFSPIFYLYVSYYYTDILMLPFASVIIYLMVKNKEEESLKNNIFTGLLIGILSIIGYKIRAVAIFLLIAYLIYILISKKMLIILKKFVPIIIGAFITLLAVNTLENNFFPNVESEKEFPMTHWIMMGVNEKSNGYYSQDDYNLSSSASNISDRINLNIKEIKNRLNNLGVFKTAKLMTKKLVTVWGKGDYSYQKYLELVNDYNITYQYAIEDKNIVINYLLQISKIVVLVFSIMGLIKLYKKEEKSFLSIAIFGAIIFYLIWEVCPRYGLSFLPWLFLLGSVSYDNLNINLDKINYSKYLKYSLLIITILFFIIGFNKYTSISLKSNIVAKDTVKKIKYITLDKNTNITQSIKLNNEFNEIRLKFRVKDKSHNSSYKLEILNKEKEVVYEEKFSDNDIILDEYTVFKLNENIEKGNYFIKLSANSDNNIDVYIAYKEEFDYYKNGSLKVNNQEETGDLMFEVVYNEERGIYTYFEYMSLMVLCIMTEYIVFFRKKETK